MPNEPTPELKMDEEDRIVAKIRSKVDMRDATPDDWVWETLAVLEAEGRLIAPELKSGQKSISVFGSANEAFIQHDAQLNKMLSPQRSSPELKSVDDLDLGVCVECGQPGRHCNCDETDEAELDLGEPEPVEDAATEWIGMLEPRTLEVYRAAAIRCDINYRNASAQLLSLQAHLAEVTKEKDDWEYKANVLNANLEEAKELGQRAADLGLLATERLQTAEAQLLSERSRVREETIKEWDDVISCIDVFGNQSDEFGVDADVVAEAQKVAITFRGFSMPVPRIGNHGRRSLVLDWEYFSLTIDGSGKIFGLLSAQQPKEVL